MKAIVMEVKDGYAAVLREDGVFEKIKRDCSVGETIELEAAGLKAPGATASAVTASSGQTNVRKTAAKKLSFPGARNLVAAAAAALFIVSGVGYQKMSVEAYSYVTVDVNPSIEYTLNRMNQVINVEAVNEEAEEIVAQLKAADINHKSLSDNMEETENLLKEAGYITDDEDYILMNVVSRNDSHKERIEDEVNKFAKDPGREKDTFVITEGTTEDRTHAREYRMSTGRFCEIQRMDDPDFETFRKRPVEELMLGSGRIMRRGGVSEDSAPEDSSPEVENAPEFGNLPGEDQNGTLKPAEEDAALQEEAPGEAPEGTPGVMLKEAPEGALEEMPKEAPDGAPEGGPGMKGRLPGEKPLNEGQMPGGMGHPGHFGEGPMQGEMQRPGEGELPGDMEQFGEGQMPSAPQPGGMQPGGNFGR